MTKPRTFDGKSMTGTGPWAGFSFVNGNLVTPENHVIEPHQLTWLSFTCEIAREFRRMMDDERLAVAEARPIEPVTDIRSRLRHRRRLRAAAAIKRP
ncbi:DUF3653 domain-containing protein [Xanthomonas citri pv. citri]